MGQITFKIPTPLQPYAEGRGQIPVEAGDVSSALDALAEAHPALVQRIRARDGSLRPYVNLFVGSTDIRQIDGLGTALANGDEVVVMPSVAGG